MGCKDDGDPTTTLHLSISNKEQFIEGCVSLLKEVSIDQLLDHPPEIDNFLQAYVIARAIPFITERRERSEDWLVEEAVDDLLGNIASKGERFLDKWTPKSATEAALMLDLVNSIGEPCANTSHILPAVEGYLFQTMNEVRGVPDSYSAPLSAVRLEAQNQLGFIG